MPAYEERASVHCLVVIQMEKGRAGGEKNSQHMGVKNEESVDARLGAGWDWKVSRS